MAYDVKYIGEKEEIKPYLDNREDRIEEIVQEGANSNGRFVKFGDGTMICTGTVILNNRIWALKENDSLRGEWPFPAEFMATPFMVGSMQWKVLSNPRISPFDLSPVTVHTGFSNKSKAVFQVISGGEVFGSDHTLNVEAIAMGRWK